MSYFVIGTILVCAQTNNYSTLRLNSSEEHPRSLNLYAFKFLKNQKSMQVAYLVNDPYQDYVKTKNEHQLLLATSASFSSSFDLDKDYPIGFCAKNGKVYNKTADVNMDALVLIDEINGLRIIDLDNVGKQFSGDSISKKRFDFRRNPFLKYNFLKYIKTNSVSAFQTQLVYSRLRTYNDNFDNLFSGKNDRGRRFLVICKKDNIDQHIIVDVLKEDYLMHTAKITFDTLIEAGYEVFFIINLDTGSKDVIHAYNGRELENLRPNPTVSHAYIEKSLSLLVYFQNTDKK